MAWCSSTSAVSSNSISSLVPAAGSAARPDLPASKPMANAYRVSLRVELSSARRDSGARFRSVMILPPYPRSLIAGRPLYGGGRRLYAGHPGKLSPRRAGTRGGDARGIGKKAQKSDPEARRPVRDIGQRDAEPGLRYGKDDRQNESRTEAARQLQCGRRRSDHQREDQQDADDLRRFGYRQRHHNHEHHRDEAQRDAARLGQFGIDGGEQQRARNRGEAEQRHQSKNGEIAYAGKADAKYVAKQQRRRLRRIGRIKMQKQNAEAERQRQDDADSDIAAAQPVAEHAHRGAGGQSENDKAP